jgi:hypothetical protein
MIVEVVVRVLNPADGSQVIGALRQDSIVVTPDVEQNSLAAQERAHALAEDALAAFDAQCDATRAAHPPAAHGGLGRRR